MTGGPPIVRLRHGNGKLLVSIPHAGTYVPAEIAAHLTPIGRAVVDTDWHVDRLYSFLEELDVTVLAATHSRTVVDLNRSPLGGALYPGQTETGLCPTESFDGAPLYARHTPDAAEIAHRAGMYWQPYHTALSEQITRLRALHGQVRVLDGHSIRGEIPRLFEGSLPDLNFGTYDGAACQADLAQRVVVAAGDDFAKILNGRFKGGYITRHYGKPADSVHVIQLELAQRTYMDEAAPGTFDPARAGKLLTTLRRVVAELLRA